MRHIATAVIVILALAAGFLHLGLDAVLFHWQLSPFPTIRGRAVFNPLPILFLLNCVGYLLLVAFLLWASSTVAAYSRLANMLLLAMTIGTLVGWNIFHRPNPRNLGAVAVTIEVVLVLVLLVNLVTMRRRDSLSLAA